MQKIVLWGGKGGTGKTTLASNLAVAAAQEGMTVTLLDTDEQKNLLGWQDRRPADAPAIQCVATSMPEAPAALRQIPACDLLVIDTPPSITAWPAAVQTIVHAADLVLIPTQASQYDLETVIDAMHYVHREGRRGLFVVNLADRTRELHEAIGGLGEYGDVAAAVVRRLVEFKRSAASGLGVLEMAAISNAGKDIAALWREISRRLNGRT